MNPIITKPHLPYSTQEPESTQPPWLLLFLVIGIILAIVSQFKGVDFLEDDGEGNVRITESRKEKLRKELEELDDAEQYALVVERPGYYPCFSCPQSDSIFLYHNDIWRYGATKLKEAGRYKKSLLGSGLVYVVQYRGSYQECLRQEKIKIYYYAELPENTKREIPLIRPPGNKVDR